MRKFASLFMMLMLFAALAFGQDRTITGTVTDEAGLPVAGASVRIKGTRTGVAADNNGQFRILAKAGDVILITGAGIEPAEATVGAASTISISVKKATITGTEVVVTALGIRRSEKAVGYAITKVDPNSVLQKSEPDLLKGLQGKVPGVDIRTSQGTPGAATRIQIRGNSSFGQETQPLIVVDGVPYSNVQVSTTSSTSGGTAYGSGIADLDPNDIESFNVLKGAAAASLYGSRASRGVIVITTKSGSAKKGAKPLNVSVKSSASVEKIANLPDYQNKYGTGSQMGYANSNGSWGAPFDRSQSPGIPYVTIAGSYFLNNTVNGGDSIAAWPEYLAAYPLIFSSTGRTLYRAYPDNVNDLFRTGSLFENSVNVNGGDANSSISLTASNVNHKGYVENSSFVKNNISAGGQTRYKNLTVGGNLSYSRSKQKGGYFGENQVGGAASQFARTLFLGRNWDLSLPYQDALGRPLIPNGGAQFDNPHWAAINNVATTIEERIVTGIRFAYRVNKWINISYNFGSNSVTLNRDELTQEFSRAAGGLGRIIEDGYRSQELQSTLVATFTPKIGKDFTLDFKLGNDINQRTSRRQTNTGLDFIVPGIYNLVNTATQSFGNDNKGKRRISGLFGEATLGYKGFAFINVAGRNDRTSTLPYKNASYFYPGVSGSFVFTDAFKIKSNTLDYGKIRIGWAKVGNDAPANQGEDVFVINQNFLGQPSTSLNSQTNDPELTPEFTKELEGGIDLSFFKRRINLDFTAYRKISTDLIFAIAIPSTTGFGSFLTNIGEISNKGIEIGLTVRPIATKNFTWEIRGSYTKNKNVVEELAEGLVRAPLGGGFSNGVSTWFEPGKPYGYLRGSVVDRDSVGNVLINPTTGWALIALDQGDIGDPNPEYKLGINNGFSYKGISLSCLFDMTKGGDMYTVTVNSELGRGVTEDTKDREATWVIPGVYGDPNTHKPIYVGGKTVVNQTRITTNDLFFGAGSFAINGPDQYSVYDATVYRLRELTLGYDLPKSIVKKLGVASATLSISGRNLWYLAPNFPKHTNFDPEVNSYGSSPIQGLEFSAAPTTRRVGINLNVTF